MEKNIELTYEEYRELVVDSIKYKVVKEYVENADYINDKAIKAMLGIH